MTRIGVTGHQRIDDPSAWPWVEGTVNRSFDVTTPPLVIVSSLAIEDDQLLARLGAARGAALQTVVPFADIERTFSSSDLKEYRRLLSLAKVEVLQTPGSDEDAYLAAGKRVVDLSDMVIAIWDGKPAKKKGGTADIVAYANASGKRVIHVNPVDRTVDGSVSIAG